MKQRLIFSFSLLAFQVILMGLCMHAQCYVSKHGPKKYDFKYIIYGRIDSHMEQRDIERGVFINPEFSVGLDRRVYHLQNNYVYLGLRGGLFCETTLTGLDYSHVYRHPFIGFYPSYTYNPYSWLRVSLAGACDAIIETQPELHDVCWFYLGIEPSIQFFPVKNIFLSIGASTGRVLAFQPPVSMSKLFFKMGYMF